MKPHPKPKTPEGEQLARRLAAIMTRQGAATMTHWFSLHRLSDSFHYMVMPFLAFAVGLGLFHARDHKS